MCIYHAHDVEYFYNYLFNGKGTCKKFQLVR